MKLLLHLSHVNKMIPQRQMNLSLVSSQLLVVQYSFLLFDVSSKIDTISVKNTAYIIRHFPLIIYLCVVIFLYQCSSKYQFCFIYGKIDFIFSSLFFYGNAYITDITLFQKLHTQVLKECHNR